MPSSAFNQLPWVLLVFALFAVYGGLVRQGRLRGRRVLWIGAVISVVAVVASAFPFWGVFRSGVLPLPLFLLNPLIMAGVSAWAVGISYRSQLVTDLATLTVGDTKIIVRVCQPSRIPDADALILPLDTNLQASDGDMVSFQRASGVPVIQALRKAGPVKMGQVVTTDKSDLATAKIMHVTVSDYPQPVAPERLRKGIEAGLQQARKARVESLVLPVGKLRGLSAQAVIEETVAVLLKHHKPFAEVVFVALTTNNGRMAAEVIEKQIAVFVAESPAKRS